MEARSQYSAEAVSSEANGQALYIREAVVARNFGAYIERLFEVIY